MGFDIFFSYNDNDREQVEEIALRLQREGGVRIFFDRWYIQPGDTPLIVLETALSACATIAVFVGPSGLGKWQKEELAMAIRRATESMGDCRVIPVWLPGADISSLGFLANRNPIDFRTSITDYGFSLLISSIRNKKLLWLLDKEIVTPVSAVVLPKTKVAETGSLKNRLNREAMYLSEIGFDVELQFLSGGFGLSLPINKDFSLGYWIPLDYPQYPPRVFAVASGDIQELQLDISNWSPEITLAEITAAIVEEEILPGILGDKLE